MPNQAELESFAEFELIFIIQSKNTNLLYFQLCLIIWLRSLDHLFSDREHGSYWMFY